MIPRAKPSASWTARLTRVAVPALLALGVVSACGQPAAAPPVEGRPAPVYDSETGRLKELVSDRNHDGKPDMWAYVDGPRIDRIELDRNGDGRVDRWEHYGPPLPGATSGAAPPLVRAEEANGGDERITRREFYVQGVIDRVEEDGDGDGRIDKWEQYTRGALGRVDMDLQGKGFADRRLIYGTAGDVDGVEEDPDGDGRFVPVKWEPKR